MDFKFCPHCGASLAGAPGADFCPACGGALGGDGKKPGKSPLRAVLAVLLGGALLVGLWWFCKALPTPLFASDSPWLCFTAESADATVGLEAEGDAPEVTLETSTDGRTWNDWAKPRIAYLHQPGDKLYVRAKNANRSFANKNGSRNRFTISGKVAASGNVMSLLDRDGKLRSLAGRDSAFLGLFYDCKGLTTAPLLPATKLAKQCYNTMFLGCKALAAAPELPATELEENCYGAMFMGCTALTKAPALPATTLAKECYNYMFEGCTALPTAPALPATTLAEECYIGMFSDCAALAAAPELPATDLAWNCYALMFSGCASLTAAPALPATKLAGSCYQYMFMDCPKLTSAPRLPATKLATNCYDGMFTSCTGLTRAPELPATELASSCYHTMFKDCAKLTAAPVIPTNATKREYSGIDTMFEGCDGIKDKPKK